MWLSGWQLGWLWHLLISAFQDCSRDNNSSAYLTYHSESHHIPTHPSFKILCVCVFFCRPMDRSPRRREPVWDREKIGEESRGAAEDVAFRFAIGVALAPVHYCISGS